MSYKSTDVKTPGIVAIAKKWKLPVAKVMELINQGAEVEKEHNKSIVKARQVARDHINERPDYYSKLKKMEKTPISMKEETGTSGVRGLGYTSGDPAGTNYVQQYVDTNALSYDDLNGNNLEYNKKNHKKYHRLSFNDFDPKNIKTAKNFVNEGISAGPERSSDYSIGDPGGGRTLYRPLDVKEGAKIDKAKKVAMAGITAANMYTMADVAGRATEGGHGSPKADIVRAASALPGAAGWGATAVHYGKKGYELAKDVLKKKKDKMEEEQIKEDLRKWFREKWVRYDTKGNIKGPCAREEGEGKPKCRPLASARAMSKDERAKSARRKRREDPVADRSGKGGKPINVQTEETLLEKNVPTNPALWARAKAQAKAKFDVYPSAYANGWASKWYKSKGGGWKSAANESIEEACWDTHRQEGMKKKGGKMVPNCVPKEEVEIDEVAAWQRKEGKNPEGGLNRKGIASYRRENPGSKLSMAVTTEPSKLKPGSKAAKRRKSFCARMGGMPGPMKDEKGRPTRKALSLRKWNCEEENNALPQTTQRGIYEGDTPKKEVIYTHKKGPLYGTVTQHDDGTISSRRKVGMFWRGRTHSSKESAIAHLENDGKKKKLKEDALDADSINAISREARVRDPQSLKGVLNVIHNRMTSGKYASTPRGVLSQKGQFQAWGKGSAKGMTDADRQNIQKTWDDISSGREKDITGGANEFRTTSAKNRPGGQSIGGNTYYKTGSFAKAKTPEPTQVASITKPEPPKAPEAPKPTQVASITKPEPPKAPEAPKPTQVASSEPSSTSNSYSVQKGDTLSGISKKYGVDTDTLAKSSGISDPNKIAIGQKINIPHQDKPTQVASINELSAETLGSYIKKASASRKKSLEGPKADIKTWGKRQKGITTAIKQLTKENSRDKDYDIASSFNEQWFNLNKTGMSNTIQEETTMENQNLVNEAIENILDNNLNEMKENLMSALQEKANEKLEERKKIIAANYFAQ